MKSPSLLLARVVRVGLVFLFAGAFVKPAQTQSGDLAATLDAIRQAPEPSAAIDAYVRASALAPDSPAVEEAYVHRMVAFGLPEMANAQAEELVRHDPRNGLGWGVLAYTLGARGQTSEALLDLAQAVRFRADDAFVQRTAGQLLAWYDVVADQAMLPQPVREAAKTVRGKLENDRAYAEAYQAARRAYEGPIDTSQPSGSTVVPPPMEYEQAAPAEQTYNYYESPSVYPYAPYPYYQPYPGFVGGYYDGCWWPSSSSVVIVPPLERDEYFHHHRFFHQEPAFARFPGFPSPRWPGHFAGDHWRSGFGVPSWSRGGSGGFAPRSAPAAPHASAPPPALNRAPAIPHFAPARPAIGGGGYRAPAGHSGGGFSGGARGSGFAGGGSRGGSGHGGGGRR